MGDYYRENFGNNDNNYSNRILTNNQEKLNQPMNLNSMNIDENNLSEYIQMLIEHQKNCERQAKYVEAEMARKRVIELKAEYDKRQKSDVKSKHLNERVQIEQAHLTEFTQFNEFWDEKMNQFSIQSKELLQQLAHKHQEELEQFQQELDQYLPIKPKDSAELLNMRKIQENLAKMEKYIDAHKMQQKAIQQEKDELERWLQVREQKLKNLSAQLEMRHGNEKQALLKRIQSGEEEQRKSRSIELERLLQKYQNVKQELESQQQNELITIQKTIKSQGSVFVKQNVNRPKSANRVSYASTSKKKSPTPTSQNFKR